MLQLFDQNLLQLCMTTKYAVLLLLKKHSILKRFLGNLQLFQKRDEIRVLNILRSFERKKQKANERAAQSVSNLLFKPLTIRNLKVHSCK